MLCIAFVSGDIEFMGKIKWKTLKHMKKWLMIE